MQEQGYGDLAITKFSDRVSEVVFCKLVGRVSLKLWRGCYKQMRKQNAGRGTVYLAGGWCLEVGLV